LDESAPRWATAQQEANTVKIIADIPIRVCKVFILSILLQRDISQITRQRAKLVPLEDFGDVFAGINGEFS
jgi:hypothetical protein